MLTEQRKKWQNAYKRKQRVFRCYFDRATEQDLIKYCEEQGDNFLKKRIIERYNKEKGKK